MSDSIEPLSFQHKVINLILDWQEANLVKFGNFTLKSGQQSSVYLDLRSLINVPKLLDQSIDLMLERYNFNPIQKHKWLSTHICGIPYTGLFLATLLSQKTNANIIYKRKEVKEYGTKKLIEGKYSSIGQVFFVDDVITSGSSILESIEALKNNIPPHNFMGIFVLVDRRPNDQLGLPLVTPEGVQIPVFSLTTLKDMIYIYASQNKLPMDFRNPYITSYKQRSKRLGINDFSKDLLELMYRKKSNLVLSADVTSMRELTSLVKQTAEQICILKIHADIIIDFNLEEMQKIKEIGGHPDTEFMIMEDRKLSDIGNTAELQLTGGHTHIITWADAITVHSVMGPGTLKAIENLHIHSKKLYVFLLAQASSKGNLIDEKYTYDTIRLAEKYPNVVSGFICQHRIANDHWLHATPGVKIAQSTDKFNQTYRKPHQAVQSGSDLVIVGRGIYQADNPKEKAELYRKMSWEAYALNFPSRSPQNTPLSKSPTIPSKN